MSVAAADYACCPYDDYGMPETNCVSVLTEKSPFATANINNALVAQESFACKAWEANAGAANENLKPVNGVAATVNDWGSCGFQRHFPWYNKKPDADTDPLVKIGLFKTNTHEPLYEVFGTGGSYGSTGTNWNMLSLTQGSFSNAGNMPITGEVHLGGVCKLFVPVQMDYIRQVSVAGVHINNARIFAGTSRAFSAEMSAVVVGKTATGTASTPWTGKFHAGTAYCFSVVNIAEFMTNRANLIANANVAGTDTRTDAEKIWYGDDQGLQYKTNGNTESAQFGTIWPGYAGTTDPSAGTAGQKTSGQHKVNMGSNFDVVVHFDSAWCSAHWTHVDMQKDQDHGAGTNTDIAGDNLKGFNNGAGAAKEAMMDAWDKRLPGNVGSCGLCMDHSQVTPGAKIGAVTSQCADNTWNAGSNGVSYTMGQTEAFNYHGILPTTGVPSSCANINEYTSGTDKRWPNAGAWAAFYSFVTCARSDYMIYGFATRTLRTVTLATGVPNQENVPASTTYNEPGSATHLDKAEQNNDNRMIVVGGWHQDYRHGQGTCVRFNLRQVGENVKYCADGDEEQFNAKDTNSLYKNPTGDTKAWSQDHPNRCTWNWNYKNLANTYDAEAWFDSIDPLHMQVWEVNAVSQTAAEKFIDEPLPGATNTAGFQAAVVANTLTSPVVINVLMQERRRTVNGGTAGTYVDPSNLVMDSSHAVVSALTHFDVGDNPGADHIAFDNTSGFSTAKITLSCDTASPKYNGGTAGSARMRDHFPDCFFGDELHGQWEWSTGLSAVDGAANTAVWKFWAMLHSH